MAKTKIAWCDEVWNPFWGCLRGCPYCYARKIAKRFGKTERERAFLPCVKSIDFPKFSKSTQRVFVGSMSDPEYWEIAWWHYVAEVVRAYPRIDFIFLTKGPMSIYREIMDFAFHNVILGLTRTTMDAMLTMRHPDALDMAASRWLLNIEPIQEPIAVGKAIYRYDWIIVGAETGNRKNKPVPTWFWFNQIVAVRRDLPHPLAIFMKPSLRPHVPDGWTFRQEFPGRRDVR